MRNLLKIDEQRAGGAKPLTIIILGIVNVLLPTAAVMEVGVEPNSASLFGKFSHHC